MVKGNIVLPLGKHPVRLSLSPKYRFWRAAGAVARVEVERHLSQIVSTRAISISKKNPTIGDFNEALKAADVRDLPQWRYIQHLADLRNLCDHAKLQIHPGAGLRSAQWCK